MFKRGKRMVSILLAGVMLAGTLAGCSGSAQNAGAGNGGANGASSGGVSASGKEPITLKVLGNGDKPNDWDKVMEEFNQRTKDELNITFDWTWIPSADYKDKLNVKITAGEQYDLVFDAPWMHLRTLAEDDLYTDLSPYLNNDDYPGLKRCFPEEIMKYNQYSDINCALPLMITYSSVNLVMYRQDWAREFGIGEDGQITSHDELRDYLQAVKDNKPGVTPIALKDNRGFYHLFTAIQPEFAKNHIYQGTLGQDIFFLYKLNEEETKVEAVALPGDPAENWEPFGMSDPWKAKLESQREWNQFTEVDSLNQKDPYSLFQIGKAGACIETIDAVPKFNRLLKSNDPTAELGVYIHEEAARNMEKDAYGAVVTSNNCLAIPASSKHVERTIEFLDWMFASAENHDLFEYGIEGVHWLANGDNQYTVPEGVSASSNYNLNGWNLTWTPEYYRFSSDYTDYSIPYAEYAIEMDNFYISKNTGFVFQSDPVKTEITQNGAILGEILVPTNHGILDDPYEKMCEKAAEMRKNNVQKALDEYVNQLNAYLEKQ